jgi:FMN phosphatase YigB (HAD superfamily)
MTLETAGGKMSPERFSLAQPGSNVLAFQVESSEPENKNLIQREIDVLGGGFVDGIGRAGSQTWKDLKQGGKDFVDDPLATTGRFIGNHWHEAVAGAAIAAMAPRKWMNTALLAFSLRGVATNTVRAGYMALDPNNDTSAIRNYYADAISHEGTAFLSSLPMTMVGGLAGKAGANAVFGKNMGALDLASGKVTMADVKTNLRAIGDTLNPPKVKLVVTDMDNTLSNFSKYEALGVREGISNMSAKLNAMGHPVKESELYQWIGKEMDLARSHDYPWSVELALGQRLNVGKPGGMTYQQFRTEISEPFWKTMDDSLAKNLHLFEGPTGVTNSLAALKDQGIPVVVLSDAPANMALKRLTAMGLDNKVERLYALHNWKEPTGLAPEMLALGRERLQAHLNTPHQLKEFRIIPKEWEKPHAQGFKALMEHYGVRGSEVLMIGDSRVKDLGVAQNSGARAIWAEYGNPPAVYENILNRLRPYDSSNPSPSTKPGRPKQYPPMLEQAESWGAVLNHLAPQRNYYDIGSGLAKSLWIRPAWQPALGFDPIPWTDELRPFTASDKELLNSR